MGIICSGMRADARDELRYSGSEGAELASRLDAADARENAADWHPVEPPGPVVATFYAVRNEKGQFYRTYDKNRSSGWKDELEDAKLWTRIGPAKSKITALSNENPKLPVPELVEFVVREVKVVDQRARVAVAKEKREREEAERARAHKQQQFVDAQYELARAQARVEKLKKGM
jgi:hypothetical protein